MGRWVWGKGCVVQDQPDWLTRLAHRLLSGFTHLAHSCCQGLRTLHSSLLAKDCTSSSVLPSLSAWVQKSAHERCTCRGGKAKRCVSGQVSSLGAEACT